MNLSWVHLEQGFLATGRRAEPAAKTAAEYKGTDELQAEDNQAAVDDPRSACLDDKDR